MLYVYCETIKNLNPRIQECEIIQLVFRHGAFKWAETSMRLWCQNYIVIALSHPPTQPTRTIARHWRQFYIMATHAKWLISLDPFGLMESPEKPHNQIIFIPIRVSQGLSQGLARLAGGRLYCSRSMDPTIHKKSGFFYIQEVNHFKLHVPLRTFGHISRYNNV